MAHRAIEGYDKLPTLYTNYVASSIRDMNGTGYTPSQVWMDYTASSLIDANGVNSAGADVFKGGEWRDVIGTEHTSATRYMGNGSSGTLQTKEYQMVYYYSSSNGTYGKYARNTLHYRKNGSISVTGKGESVEAIDYNGTLYEKGSASVRACGPKVTYKASSASPRLYTASGATVVTLKKAELSTATATVLKI